ncbi:hypothetical protein ACB496_15235 [Lelliottia nimipressuralis]|uniref:hypothetical protein n=1 Tax=Lelliottia nimipressuralis TaxID=69220 RepID=UPI003557DD6D
MNGNYLSCDINMMLRLQPLVSTKEAYPWVSDFFGRTNPQSGKAVETHSKRVKQINHDIVS